LYWLCKQKSSLVFQTCEINWLNYILSALVCYRNFSNTKNKFLINSLHYCKYLLHRNESNLSDFILHIHAHSDIKKTNQCIKRSDSGTSPIRWLCPTNLLSIYSTKLSKLAEFPLCIQKASFILMWKCAGMYKLIMKTSSPCIWISGADSSTLNYIPYLFA
jgi:hypothetical protein